MTPNHIEEFIALWIIIAVLNGQTDKQRLAKILDIAVESAKRGS